MCTLKGLHMYLAHHILSVLFPYYILGNNITAEKSQQVKVQRVFMEYLAMEGISTTHPATTLKAQGALCKKGWKCSKLKEL